MNSKPIITNLKRLFYIAFGVEAILFVSFAFKWITLVPQATTIPYGVETWSLLITLVGIPGALKLFSVIMNKNKHPKDSDSTTAQYKKAFITRFGILFLVASLNIVLYALSFNQNFMLLTLVTFIAYIFSYPTENDIDVVAEEEKEEQLSEDDKEEITDNK